MYKERRDTSDRRSGGYEILVEGKFNERAYIKDVLCNIICYLQSLGSLDYLPAKAFIIQDKEERLYNYLLGRILEENEQRIIDDLPIKDRLELLNTFFYTADLHKITSVYSIDSQERHTQFCIKNVVIENSDEVSILFGKIPTKQATCLFLKIEDKPIERIRGIIYRWFDLDDHSTDTIRTSPSTEAPIDETLFSEFCGELIRILAIHEPTVAKEKLQEISKKQDIRGINLILSNLYQPDIGEAKKKIYSNFVETKFTNCRGTSF